MIKIFIGDSLDLLDDIDENSIDSCVTDPPYEIGFMGNKWDKTGISYNVDFWKKILLVLKPGAHSLVFGYRKRYHRVFCALEDAGFEIRDTLIWLNGNGFPKGKNLGLVDSFWSGWSTELKPAYEPILLVRKPLDGTLKQNLDKWGVGGLNIDDCRVGPRYPSNVLLGYADNCTDCPVKLIDDQSGDTGISRGGRIQSGTIGKSGIYGKYNNVVKGDPGYGDRGGASRFFYCSKAPSGERFGHPTAKPIDLISYLVRLITPYDGFVLDPFFGSGTTGLACKNNNFNCIGMEINREYVEMARKRLA